MNTEIALIAPDQELFELAEELKVEFSKRFCTFHAFLEDGVAIASSLQNKGIKVIVSRGGTTNKLRNSNIHLPIIDIPITDYEVINLLDTARKISSNIAVIGFTDSLVQRAQILAPILGVEVKKYYVQSEKDVKENVERAREMGYEVIIGAKLAVEYAEKLGMKGVLLKSPKSVVQGALKEAFKVLDALNKEREVGERLKTILDSIHEGIISLDKERRIIHFNELAGKVLNIKGDNVIGKSGIPLLTQSGMAEALRTGERWVGEIRDFNGIKYVCNIHPILVNHESIGSIISFQELGQLQILEQKARRNLYQKGHVARHCFEDILSVDPLMEKVIIKAKKYAKVDSTILVQGESGTGKEMFVQSLHNASERKHGPFVAVNCAVLPEHLLESELFGYVDGAFTGAKKGGKVGLFELAHGGTLFLDEIGEISEAVQASLLRVIEEKRIMRIGDDKVIPIDVRIFCATNKSLKIMVKEGKFREDLFYRINILKIELPPLRERIYDVPLLIQNYLKYFSNKFNIPLLKISNDSLKLLQSYTWPGNIRELKNVVERLVIGAKDEELTPEDILEVMDDFFDLNHKVEFKKEMSLREQEELKLIHKVLEDTHGNKAEAARILGISKTTLWRKMKACQ